jgi:hypothetical protein
MIAGLGPEKTFKDIRQAIPEGGRKISDREITDAINKALGDIRGGTFTPRTRPEPVVKHGKATLQKIIDQGTVDNDADLWESSPIRLLGDPKADRVLLLETLFRPEDLVWIGDRVQPGILGVTIKTAGAWITFYRNDGKTAPHICINPLNGIPTLTKTSDKISLRGDNNVVAFKYALVEFDDLSREDQIRFWSAVKLPIVALIDTAGKSVHALLQVSRLVKVTTLDEWATSIKGLLYDRLLSPLGVDVACSNPARLSRLPGHYRAEKAAHQRLLWLAPEGRPICQ